MSIYLFFLLLANAELILSKVKLPVSPESVEGWKLTVYSELGGVIKAYSGNYRSGTIYSLGARKSPAHERNHFTTQLKNALDSIISIYESNK
jgi:hypothetical protein